jgi:multicomponent Na+:H+ antiporter subunit G
MVPPGGTGGQPRGDPMRALLDVYTYAMVSFGAFFYLAGTVGLLRFPDAYTRLHALTKADNLGLALIVSACCRRSTACSAASSWC